MSALTKFSNTDDEFIR